MGAVYNGQYAKGLLHVVIFGSIISILSSGAAQGFVPLFGLMIPTFVFYMAFEAYHTAKKRRDGEMVDEFSGLVRARGARRDFHGAGAADRVRDFVPAGQPGSFEDRPIAALLAGSC